MILPVAVEITIVPAVRLPDRTALEEARTVIGGPIGAVCLIELVPLSPLSSVAWGAIFKLSVCAVIHG